MIYGIVERKGFVSITGEVGTGKTTLIRRVLEQLGPKNIRSVYIYPGRCTVEEILREILQELDLSPPEGGKLSLRRSLNDFLLEGLPRKENLALIIDEAHTLTPDALEELRLVSNLETNRSKLLQIVLVGQPELVANLNAPELRQLKQRIAISRTIKPLIGEESRHYIDHRLNLVGSRISDVFRPDAIHLICDYGRGVPRVINMLCDNSLLIGYGLKKRKIDVPIVKEAIRDMGLSFSMEEIPSPIPLGKGMGGNGELGLARRRAELHMREKPKRSYRYTVSGGLAVILISFLLLFFLGREYRMEVVQGSSSTAKVMPGKFSTDERKEAKPLEVSAPEVLPATENPGPIKEIEAPPQLSRPVQISGLLSNANTEKARAKIITVGKGDTLSLLAQKNYEFFNSTLIDKILEFNPGITNIHLVNVGQKISLPTITEESMVVEAPGGQFRIHVGTVSRLSYAASYRDEPALKGKSIEIVPRKVTPEETWYRIYAGKYSSREEALSALRATGRNGTKWRSVDMAHNR